MHAEDLDRLRALHDGRLTDYVAWVAVGTAVLCGTLVLVLV